MDLTDRARRVLILIAHTGSGHLRAAEAVAEALRRRYGAAAVVEILDAVGDYAPFPFCRLADLYPRWIDQAQVTWDWGYKLTDGPRRAKGLLRLFWPLVWPRARRLLCQYPLRSSAIIQVSRIAPDMAPASSVSGLDHSVR